MPLVRSGDEIQYGLLGWARRGLLVFVSAVALAALSTTLSLFRAGEGVVGAEQSWFDPIDQIHHQPPCSLTRHPGLSTESCSSGSRDHFYYTRSAENRCSNVLFSDSTFGANQDGSLTFLGGRASFSGANHENGGVAQLVRAVES
jgi:hypothetical protein